jgi:hypothetical protein
MMQVPCGTSTTLGVQLAELYRLKDDGSVRTMASDECVSILVVTPNNTRHSINPRLALNQLSYHAAVTFKEVGVYEIQVGATQHTASACLPRARAREREREIVHVLLRGERLPEESADRRMDVTLFCWHTP